jgi:3-hydroxyisobutyrate dehydrogenase
MLEGKIRTMKAGFIGMSGQATLLARRLLAARLAVVVWDADGAAVEGLSKAGASAAASPAAVAQGCDVLIVSMSRGTQVHDLLFGAEALAASVPAGTILVDLSPSLPSEARERARLLAKRGVSMLDAAVFTTAAEAEPADMTLVLAGTAAEHDRAAGRLAAITPNVVAGGATVGTAQALRLLIATVTVSSGLASLEAIAAGRRMGLSLRSMNEVFVKGSARNYITRFMLPALAQGKTALGDPLSQVMQDLDDAIGVAIASGMPTPISSAARGLLRIAANSLGEQAVFEDVAQVIATMARTRMTDEADAEAATAPAPQAAGRSPLKIGYVGVGAMGGALARRLMQTYAGMVVFDARAEIAQAFEAQGASVAADLPSLARACDVIMVCVPGSDIVRKVLFGPGGLAEGLSAGKIVIDQTTGDPVVSAAIAAELNRLGVPMVDAPVSGGPETPEAGTSVMICGGPPDAFARVLPVLTAIGPNVHYCGPAGSGHAAKLVNNASNICNRAIAYEAAMLACQYGVPLDVMHRVVNASTGWSWAGQRMYKAVKTHAQTADIRLELSLKDIASAVQMGIACGAPMLVCDTVRSLWAGGVHQYGKDSNVDEIAHLFERISGIDFTAG